MISANKKFIVIGTLPPPIGGVSIYNQRLYDHLQQDSDIAVDFIDYKRHGIGGILKAVVSHKIIYLNCSSSFFKFATGVIARCLNKKFIVTFHGNLERHSGAVNLLDQIITRLATLTIVLNKQSYEYAKRYTGRVYLGTSFIPPARVEELSPAIKSLLARCRQQYRLICSSNAHNVSFDNAGNEIYQVSFLLGIFNQAADSCIILSDPSGQYYDYLQKHKISIPANVFIIRETHSYFELLKEVDVMLRITTTDGDSISVREALYLGKTVIASDVVDRPEGVIQVPIQKEAILSQLAQVMNGAMPARAAQHENAGEQILQIFKSMQD